MMDSAIYQVRIIKPGISDKVITSEQLRKDHWDKYEASTFGGNHKQMFIMWKDRNNPLKTNDYDD